jgi:NitT/TauT family transport system substrate-binding protein
MRYHRTAAAMLACTAAAVALAGCGQGTSTAGAANDAANPVTIGVSVSNATQPYVIPWLVGQKEGFFTEHGVKIGQIVSSAGGSTTVRDMLTGGLPIADAGLPAVVQASATGVPVTVVAGATQSLYGIDFYTLAKNTAVQGIGDVKSWGYTEPQSVTQALTYLLPAAARVSTNAVRRDTGGAGAGVAMLESGAVDAVVVPPSVLAKDAAPYREIASSTQLIPWFQQSVITTTPAYATSHPAVVKAVVAGYGEAVDWIAKNPDKAGQIYASYIKISPQSAEQIVTGAVAAHNWGIGFNPLAISTAVKAMDLTGSTVDEKAVCKIFDPSYLPEGASTSLPAFCAGSSGS